MPAPDVTNRRACRRAGTLLAGALLLSLAGPLAPAHAEEPRAPATEPPTAAPLPPGVHVTPPRPPLRAKPYERALPPGRQIEDGEDSGFHGGACPDQKQKLELMV